MTVTTAPTLPFRADLAALAERPAGSEPETLAELRLRAAARFAEVGLPTTQLEAWRFTNLAALARIAFRPGSGRAPADAEALLAPHRIAGACELVFVNGYFAPPLSRLTTLPEGVTVASLAIALAAGGNGAAAGLGRQADLVEHPFVALNTALFGDGAVVEVGRGSVVETPIHLLFLGCSEGGLPTVGYPRTLILAGEQSQATVVETFVGRDGETYLTCPVTELEAADAAIVDHYKVQREGVDAFHLAAFALKTGRAARVASHSISLGGGLVRHDVTAALAGTGGEATLNGLYMVEGKQLVDTHMRVDHAEPHCDSHELYKGILNGKARAVFNGRIHVHKGAQKTDAKQTNRNLLLSKDALVNTNPQLEIFADDVKCTHGSTVGQLDEEAVFYLRSRGIGEEAAKSLLTYAFASDIVERIRLEAVRKNLRDFLLGWIPHGEIVRDAT